jgi:hypothetical protein
MDAAANTSKWTGGPYTTNAVVPEDSFSVTKGKYLQTLNK